jgi:recombination protein RecA
MSPAKKGTAVKTPPKASPKASPKPPAQARKPARNVNVSQQTTLDATRSFLQKKMGLKVIEANISELPHISSGSLVIDNLIGGGMAQDGKGRNCPGYPRRRLIEIYGPEASGKTTAALSAVVQCQKAGGVAMFIDMEHALHHGYSTRLGVDMDSLLLYAPDTMEDCFKAMFGGIINGVDLIVVDSIASLVPAAEMGKDINAIAQIGAVAKKMSETLPKFVMWLDKYPVDGEGKKRKDHPGTCLMVLNQIRSKINTGGPPGMGGGEQTPGGKALKFYAYLRLKFAKAGQEKVKRIDPVSGKEATYDFGTKTEVTVVKNKIDARNGHKAKLFIRYGSGIDNYYSIIESGITHGFIQRKGSHYSYKGQSFTGRDKFRKMLVENKGLADEIEKQVISCLVADSAPPENTDEEVAEVSAADVIASDYAALGGSIVSTDSEEDEEDNSTDEEETIESDDDVTTPEEVDEDSE